LLNIMVFPQVDCPRGFPPETHRYVVLDGR
jgi:hypothetical protein